MIAKFILLSLYVSGLAISIYDHGKERKPTNGWNAFISFIIIMVLLYFSGFFKNM